MEGWKIEFCTKVNKVEYLALFIQNKLVLTTILFTFFHPYKRSRSIIRNNPTAIYS
jgi:hypothetical protein